MEGRDGWSNPLGRILKYVVVVEALNPITLRAGKRIAKTVGPNILEEIWTGRFDNGTALCGEV